jgi:hypothetical protein
MIERATTSTLPGAEDRMRRARRRGFADGVASVLGGSVTGRPARVRLRSGGGSLLGDWEALQRDGERLVHGCS